MYVGVINRRFETKQDIILEKIGNANVFQRLYKFSEFKNVMPSIINGCVNNYKTIQGMDLALDEKNLLIKLVEYYAEKQIDVCIDCVSQYRNQIEAIFIGKKLTLKNMIYEKITEDYCNPKMFEKSQYLIGEYIAAADSVYNLDIAVDLDKLICFYVEHFLDDVIKMYPEAPIRTRIDIYNSSITRTCHSLRTISKKLNMYNCLETIDDAMEEVVAKQKELVR